LGRISRGIDKGVHLNKIDTFRARRAKRLFTLTTELDKCAGADLIIEAVYDDLELKKTVFRALDDLVRPETILATTTNTLSVTKLAATTRFPERVLGLHFCNPAHIMRLVEVVRAEQTRQDMLEQALDLVRKIGKTPIQVRDNPGLVVNRIAQAYYGEALCLLDDSSLDIETIDRLMEAADFPMGPFRLMDFLGVDTTFRVTKAIFEMTYFTAPYRPHPRQQRLIEAGRLGRKNGRGFYDRSG